MRSSILTARLQLTPFALSDAPDLHVLFSDPLTHTIGSGPFTSIAQTEQWIRNRMDAQRDHGLCWYALRSRESNRLIGNCGMLRGRTAYAEPEIGYLIDTSDRGQGFATEAAQAVLRECAESGITRVWASIRPHNTPSRRIVEHLGLRVDRTEHDDRGDLLFYVIDLPHPA